MFDKLLAQNIGFYADRHSSEFAARITFGAGSAAQVLNLLINTFGRDLLSLIALIAVMVYQAPFMSIFGFVVMPPAILTVRKLMKRVRAITRTQYGGGADILKTMQETIQGFKVIKAFNLEFARARADLRQRRRGRARVQQARPRLQPATPLMEALGGIAIGRVSLRRLRVLVLNAAPGELRSFITAFLLAYEPAKRIARLNIDLHNALVRRAGAVRGAGYSRRRLGAAAAGCCGRARAHRIRPGVVCVSPRQPVLRGMTFTPRPGEVTAFVGPSGGGKSTIFNLVLALYRPQSGAIRLDGQDYGAVSEESIRRAIAFVGQDVFLFHGTIRHNIGLGRPGASDADIVAAARAAHADEFIAQFAAGYDTMVGEQGAQFSGGQRARIAIARALIRNAPIILLDEPTAALDSESERYVQDAMEKLINGRTTLVIAHRLHTIAKADIIHVVENGAIVESGRHADLLARGRPLRAVLRHAVPRGGRRRQTPVGRGGLSRWRGSGRQRVDLTPRPRD